MKLDDSTKFAYFLTPWHRVYKLLDTMVVGIECASECKLKWSSDLFCCWIHFSFNYYIKQTVRCLTSIVMESGTAMQQLFKSERDVVCVCVYVFFSISEYWGLGHLVWNNHSKLFYNIAMTRHGNPPLSFPYVLFLIVCFHCIFLNEWSYCTCGIVKMAVTM